MMFFQKEVESRERTANLTQSVQQPDKEKQWEKSYVEKRIPEKRRSYTASTASFHAVSVRDERKCIFCGGNNHRSKNCTELTLELRREKLRKEGKCFVYLGVWWFAHNCKTQGITCEECGRRHHKVLCPQLASQQEKHTEERQESTQQAARNPPTHRHSDTKCSSQ